jgi:hypothetical protein
MMDDITRFVKIQKLLREIGEDEEMLVQTRDWLDRKITTIRGEKKSIEVVEYEPYRDGHLQLTYLYTKKGTRRGPYWYFRYHFDGKQKTLYIGSANLDEAKRRVDEKRSS